MAAKLGLDGISASDLQAMDPETLLAHLEPLISHQASLQYIPGLDEDDKRQEFSLLAVRCQRRYNPQQKRGYDGRASSFIHYFITALNNRCAKLVAHANRQNGGVSRLACTVCAWEKPKGEPGCCYQCGGDAWQTIYPNAPYSLDLLLDLDGDQHEAARRLPAVLPTDSLAEAELLRSVLDVVRPEDRAEFLRAMDSGRLRKELRQQLQIRLAARWRVYSSRREKSIVA